MGSSSHAYLFTFVKKNSLPLRRCQNPTLQRRMVSGLKLAPVISCPIQVSIPFTDSPKLRIQSAYLWEGHSTAHMASYFFHALALMTLSCKAVIHLFIHECIVLFVRLLTRVHQQWKGNRPAPAHIIRLLPFD